jgi:hypothetical protein
MESSTGFEPQPAQEDISKQPPLYSTIMDDYPNVAVNYNQQDQIESMTDPEPEVQPTVPPPSYTIAKEEDALAGIQNLEGVIFELDQNEVRLQNQNKVIYLCSRDPQSGGGGFFTFMLRIYKHGANDSASPKVARSREIYKVVNEKGWISHRLPTFYSFPAESRAVHCYRPSFSIANYDIKVKWWQSIPVPGKGHHSTWTIQIHTSYRKKDDSLVLIVRKRMGHHTPAEYQWTYPNGKVIGLETDASIPLLKPKLELKTNPEDRRLVHALVLGWVTRIWHDANQDYTKQKAHDINSTLSCKFTDPFDILIYTE